MSFGQQTPAGPTGFKQFVPLGGHIELPNPDGTHTYTPPMISYELGLELRVYQERVEEVQKVARENMEAAIEAKKNGEEPERKPLPDYEFGEDEGPTLVNMLGQALLDEMRANNEPHDFVRVASQTVWIDFLYGRVAAEKYFNSGGDPKALAAHMWETGTGSLLTSTSTDEANTTKPQASTSGTKSQPKPAKKSTTTTKSTRKTNTSRSSATKKS